VTLVNCAKGRHVSMIRPEADSERPRAATSAQVCRPSLERPRAPVGRTIGLCNTCSISSSQAHISSFRCDRALISRGLKRSVRHLGLAQTGYSRDAAGLSSDAGYREARRPRGGTSGQGHILHTAPPTQLAARTCSARDS